MCIAVNDELELNQWLSALDRGARGEGLNSKLEKRTSKPLLDEKALGSGKMTSRGSGGSNKKGPVRADHTISTLKVSSQFSVCHNVHIWELFKQQP